MNILKGILIGIAKIVPGLSGTVLMISFNLYDKAIEAITCFFDNPKKNFIFLFKLFVGIMIGVVFFSKLVSYFITNYYLYTISLFIGLILGTVIYKVINKKRINLTINNIEEYLGKRIYEASEIVNDIGIVNGLAYTNFGGDILPIEANYYSGNSNLILTGSMGNVMLESAKIALSYIKANCKKFKIDYKAFKEYDIHIHVPEGGIKKDGPSAGVTLVTSIISAFKKINFSNSLTIFFKL